MDPLTIGVAAAVSLLWLLNSDDEPRRESSGSRFDEPKNETTSYWDGTGYASYNNRTGEWLGYRFP